MSFSDIDDQKSGTIFILFIQLVESGNLPPKRRSRVAAEDEHHGLPLIQRGELNVSRLVDLGK